jgi:hypothetical protein
MSLSSISGPFTTVTFTQNGISEINCFLDAAGTGQIADNDSSVPLTTEIATVTVPDPSTDVDVEVHSNLLRPLNNFLPDLIDLISGTITNGQVTVDFNTLANNPFNFRANVTVTGIDDSSVNTIGIAFAQDTKSPGMNFSGAYPPGKNLTWSMGLPVGASGSVSLICPPQTFVGVDNPVLDAGPGIDGGATPSTSTGGWDPNGQIQGTNRTITWVDAPALSLPTTQPCDQINKITSTNGGFSFNTYLITWSGQAKHSYVVIGKAGWTLNWAGNVVPGSFAWVPTADALVRSTGYIQYDSPHNGTQEGVEINSPTVNTLFKQDGTH